MRDKKDCPKHCANNTTQSGFCSLCDPIEKTDLTIEDLKPSLDDLRHGRESPYVPITIKSDKLRSDSR